jgi:hypothetical protein
MIGAMRSWPGHKRGLSVEVSTGLNLDFEGLKHGLDQSPP